MFGHKIVAPNYSSPAEIKTFGHKYHSAGERVSTIKGTETLRLVKMMKMTWMTRMINDQAERKNGMINGTWGDEEDENDEYVDDELSMTKKMTNRTCESSD